MSSPVHCTYTTACPLALDDVRHVNGCPASTPFDMPQMEQHPPDREPAWFPPYFVVGFVCGVLVAALAVIVGLVLAVS